MIMLHSCRKQWTKMNWNRNEFLNLILIVQNQFSILHKKRYSVHLYLNHQFKLSWSCCDCGSGCDEQD